MSSPGDYVLSCVHKGLIVHYQIQRLGDDPLFRIADGMVWIHGLDALLEHFRDSSQPESRCLSLHYHCQGSDPPPETLRHGRRNLLHRSVAAADHKVVSELLNADRKYNLEARDERGRTALHLAVELDEEKHYSIVEQLISAGAYVDSKDSESITPLHLCAKLNKHKFTELLITEGKAKTFVRTKEGWVALHFAADSGNAKVLEVLLRCGAAPHPRSNSNETPIDLAIKRNDCKCKELCHLYSDRPIDQLEPRNQWFCEHLKSRYDIDKLFESHSGDGTFLVRKSQSKHNTHVLVMSHNRKVYNFEIQYNNGFYFIDSGPYWPSLEHLIWYHKWNSDGLPSKLSAPLLSVINTSINEKLIEINTENNEDLESNDNNECIKSILFIDGSQVRTESLIGTGEYADVFKGFWDRNHRQTTSVAVKILRNRDIEDIEQKIDNSLKEIEVMTSLRHPNIVRLLGVCVGHPLMMIQEFAPMGSAKDFMIRYPHLVNGPQHLKCWSTQIANGMHFLEVKHFVHRDLAARNVLVFGLWTVKIGDFGLSRALKSDEELYCSSSRDCWPLRWYAPESLRWGTFSHASDVWSYGVLLWEMYCFGDHPYGHIDNCHILDYIEDGKRLSKPEECSESMYGLMCFCWAYEPKNRPTFAEIVKLMLTNDSTYESMRNELKSAIEM